MRNVILWMQQSVDGRIEGPNGEFDWPILNEELAGYFFELTHTIDTFMYGRRVYEMMAGYWPTADSDPASGDYDRKYAPVWRATPKILSQ